VSYKTLHRRLQIEHHEPHSGWTQVLGMSLVQQELRLGVDTGTPGVTSGARTESSAILSFTSETHRVTSK